MTSRTSKRNGSSLPDQTSPARIIHDVCREIAQDAFLVKRLSQARKFSAYERRDTSDEIGTTKNVAAADRRLQQKRSWIMRANLNDSERACDLTIADPFSYPLIDPSPTPMLPWSHVYSTRISKA